MSRPFTHVPFQCIVTEDGKRCESRHLEAATSPMEAEELKYQKYLCQECQKKGYGWMSQILKGADGTDEVVQELLKDPRGARNPELLSKQGLSDAQKKAGDKAKAALTGWGVVQVFEDDTLMLRREDSKNPGDPRVSRKLSTITSFAPKPSKPVDPFEGRID